MTDSVNSDLWFPERLTGQRFPCRTYRDASALLRTFQTQTESCSDTAASRCTRSRTASAETATKL